MNVLKCVNGHFYDGDMYGKCPHCGADPVSADNDNKKEKHSLSGLFGKSKSKSSGTGSGNSWSNPIPNPSQNGANRVSTVPPAPAQVDVDATISLDDYRRTAVDPDATVSLDMFNQRNATDSEATISLFDLERESKPQQVQPTPQPVSAGPVKGVPSPLLSQAAAQPEQKQEKTTEGATLQDIIKQSSASSEGKTMSYFEMSSSTKTEEPATPPAPEVLQTDVTISVAPVPAAKAVQTTAAAQSNARHCSGPVVGWLVCVSGKHLGQSFEIGAGKNSIGRNPENEIVLSLDGGVSRSKHAIVVYEPKKSDFYLQPGDSSGLTYLNDDFITEIKKLSANDVIEIGDTKLMLIPLCGEAFTWETYIN